MSPITLRFATADDVGLLLQLIRELAAYEKAPGAVVASEDDLRRHGFGPEPRFEALIAAVDGAARRDRRRARLASASFQCVGLEPGTRLLSAAWYRSSERVAAPRCDRRDIAPPRCPGCRRYRLSSLPVGSHYRSSSLLWYQLVIFSRVISSTTRFGARSLAPLGVGAVPLPTVQSLSIPPSPAQRRVKPA